MPLMEFFQKGVCGKVLPGGPLKVHFLCNSATCCLWQSRLQFLPSLCPMLFADWMEPYVHNNPQIPASPWSLNSSVRFCRPFTWIQIIHKKHLEGTIRQNPRAVKAVSTARFLRLLVHPNAISRHLEHCRDIRLYDRHTIKWIQLWQESIISIHGGRGLIRRKTHDLPNVCIQCLTGDKYQAKLERSPKQSPARRCFVTVVVSIINSTCWMTYGSPKQFEESLSCCVSSVRSSTLSAFR